MSQNLEFSQNIATAPASTEELTGSVVTTLPTPAGDITTTEPPPRWLVKLPPEKQTSVCCLPVSHLQEHPASSFLPSTASGEETVLKSVRKFGILYPLAVAADGRVLDGRYRLRAAQKLNIESVPTLLIDIEGNDAARWVLESKASREYLGEYHRAALALQFQKYLMRNYVADRSAKMTACRLGNAISQADSASSQSTPSSKKRDSRKVACEVFNVRERAFKAVKKLSDRSPDL